MRAAHLDPRSREFGYAHPRIRRWHRRPHLSRARRRARATRKYDAELLYLGDANGLETRIVPREGIPFAPIVAGKLRRYLSAETLTDLGRIPVGMRQAIGHVREFQPDAVFTSGGYVSVPAGFAARTQGVPFLMHQQDVPPNLANRLLTPLATQISVSFPDSLRYFPKDRTTLSGNPVRAEVLAMAQAPGTLRKLDFRPRSRAAGAAGDWWEPGRAPAESGRRRGAAAAARHAARCCTSAASTPTRRRAQAPDASSSCLPELRPATRCTPI